jgi:two-component sensor histidine kinase
MRAKAASLMLLNEENELTVRAAHGVNRAYREKPRLKLGEGITGRVAQTGQAEVVRDVRREPAYRYPDLARHEGLRSLLCVPLEVRERVIGVLNVYTDQPYTFSSQEIALFQTLANQTALAIENARLVVNTAVVREMHHRVKNNLQTIAMLLRLQLEEPGLDADEVLRDSINRILSIAAVHEVLSERGFRMVDVKRVLEQVAQTMMDNQFHLQRAVGVVVVGDEITLPSREATALTVAVNELVQNALKHAFAGREGGKVTITLRRRAPGFEVAVEDDGIGLTAEEATPGGLGLQIIEALVCQDLGGELTIERAEQGTRAVIAVEDADQPD